MQQTTIPKSTEQRLSTICNCTEQIALWDNLAKPEYMLTHQLKGVEVYLMEKTWGFNQSLFTFCCSEGTVVKIKSWI